MIFFATWCGPCKMMAPAVEALAAEYEGKAKIGKLDVEESADIAGALRRYDGAYGNPL